MQTIRTTTMVLTRLEIFDIIRDHLELVDADQSTFRFFDRENETLLFEGLEITVKEIY